MFIDSVINKFYPIMESAGEPSAVRELGAYLDKVYNKGGSWSYAGVNPSMGEVAELYDVYKNIVHDGVPLSKIETVSKAVSDILKEMGFDVKEHGVGWRLSESDENLGAYKLTYKVTGTYWTSARTEREAEYNIQDQDFGDLSNVSWVKTDVVDSMDGYRNDMVNVTYEVTGEFECTVKAESAARAKEMGNEIISEADLGELEDVEWDLTDVLAVVVKESKTRLPDWAEKAFADKMSKDIIDVYDAGDYVDVTSKVGGDIVIYRVRKDGTVTER